MLDYDPQSADIIAMSGRGLISDGIKVATCSETSHVGGIARVAKQHLEHLAKIGTVRPPAEIIDRWQERCLLFESTTLASTPCEITGNTIRGVQAHEPLSRIESYCGNVSYYRLTEDYRRKFSQESREENLTYFLLARIGTPYDKWEAVHSGMQMWKRLKRWLPWSHYNRSKKLFCSEYLAKALQIVDFFPLGSPSRINPRELLSILVDDEIYEGPYLIKGVA